jgi:plastocyanin
MLRVLALIVTAAIVIARPALVGAQQAVDISITVKDNKFDPAEVQAPADTPIRFKIKNLDPKPMEFESKTLKFEKIVTGGSEAIVNVRPQKPGRYEFYDDFHEETTRGALIVK